MQALATASSVAQIQNLCGVAFLRVIANDGVTLYA
jgi:hypothetical protein